MDTIELRNLYCDIKATFGNVGNKKEKYLNILTNAINYIESSVKQNAHRNMQIKELKKKLAKPQALLGLKNIANKLFEKKALEDSVSSAYMNGLASGIYYAIGEDIHIPIIKNL